MPCRIDWGPFEFVLSLPSIRHCIDANDHLPYFEKREIWLILDERERVDAMDEQEGQKPQDMVSWVSR